MSNQKVNEIAEKTKGIFINYPVKSAWLFGSVVEGESDQDSDIDILVEFDLPHYKTSELRKLWANRIPELSKKNNSSINLTIFDIVKMQKKISDKLSKEVDIIDVKRIKKRYKPNILAQRVKIYDKED